ncbi:lisH domain-containing protein ARMC9-like [Physella acuta]|uniref:lisH domain-containing protein ARMC9-like n=1 Tax=Physella acuta TaxID=109671 RepID=UPI0027DC4581|nr:lisH domain-containing protein ARMC9-like [Physella acuta]
MSGNASVVAFEGELNAIVKEYLDFSGFDKTKAIFENECKEKNKPVSEQEFPTYGSEKVLLAKNQMLEFFHEGKGDLFFKLWRDYLPSNVKNEDSVSKKLEFYLNIYFAIYPIKYGQPQNEAEEAMSNFKQYIENRGSSLSQTTEFLPFYALPFVTNPKTHPSYRELFAESWSADLKSRVEKFLTLALKSTPQPRLFEIYRGVSAEGKGMQPQLVLMSQQVIDAEKKASAYLKRHNKVQSDYHNLIGITADLVDALESTVQGKHITPEYLQHLCNRLFTTHMQSSLDLSRPGTAGDALRRSVIPTALPVTESDESYPPLDFTQIKSQITEALDRKKALILQALRWRLTRTRAGQRDQILSAYIQNDILGCSNDGPYRETIMNLLLNSSDVVKQYLARLYNACASMCAGRGYLATNPGLLPALMDILRSEVKDQTAQEMVLGALQKLSLRRQLQSAMIERGVIEWLVGVLEDNDSLSDYTLEYSVALLMNLCLRTAGKKRCVRNAHQTLKVLSDLLGHDNVEIRPYVNGALYSILAIPSIRENAKAMGMEEILKCFLKDKEPDMNRQIEFIIKQLNSSESGEDYESDEEEEDEDEEEDQEMLEADLDKDEIIRPQAGELSGEKLLSQYSLGRPPNTASRRKKLLGDEPLQRPATPGSRRVLDHSLNSNNNAARSGKQASRKTSAGGGLTAQPDVEPVIVRPPTRSGSRPSTQEKTDLRPPSQKSNRAFRPSTKAMEKIGPEANLNEYRSAFQAKPKIPRTPEAGGGSRPTSVGSIKEPPPQPQFSESGPRPSSAGKTSAPGSPRKGSSSSLGKPKTPSHM